MQLKQLQESWHKWGRQDPLFAILTFSDKRRNKWNLEEFFRTGDQEISEILSYVDSLGLTYPRGKAVDFGCGVGRLTQALGKYFEDVWGVDIAPSMIELAQSYNRLGPHCHYVLNESTELVDFADAEVDFAYSCRVLQHMEPRFCKLYLRELMRILSPSGVLVFQIPAEKLLQEPDSEYQPPKQSPLKLMLKRAVPGALHSLYWRLKRLWLNWLDSQQLKQEMYCIAKEEILQLVEEAGARVVEVMEDSSAPGFVSLRYCVIRGRR